jgi:surface antigen
MSVTQSCPTLQVRSLLQVPATEGTRLATMAVAETAAGEVTTAAPAIMAEETATAMVQVQAAMDMARPGTMQAVQARTPSLA